MNDGKFQWHDAKAESNFAHHGVTFDSARRVFDDPFAIDQLDDREQYNEDRYTIIGMSEGRLLFVSYTMRGKTTRIISARGAEPHEQRQYHEDEA